MSRHQIMVLGSALLTRLMPIVLGFAVATLFGARAYAEAVLLLTAANLSGGLPTQAIAPQVLRASDTRDAAHLAIRGILVGMLVIGIMTAAICRFGNFGGGAVFLFGYASAVLVLTVAQSLLNQQMLNAVAFRHAGAVSFAALAAALGSWFIDPAATVFMAVLGASMLAAALVSFTLVWVRVRRDRPVRATAAPSESASRNGLFAGLFSAFVMAGLFLSGLRAKQLGDTNGFVAFSFGMQVFSVVVFVPGALSAYFVPKLVRAAPDGVLAMVGGAVRSYLKIVLPIFAVAVLGCPLVFLYLHIPATWATLSVYMLIQAAAVMAAVNSAYNQVLTSSGQFARLAGLSLLWLAVLLISQALLHGEVVFVSISLCVAYAMLLLASRSACRSVTASRLAIP